MSKHPKTVCSILALIALTGCGGSGGSSSSNPSSTLPTKGKVNVKTYNIPAGQTVTVTGELFVTASEGIEIDGTLLLPPGVNVALVSNGAITGTGSILPAPTAQASNVKQAKTTAPLPPGTFLMEGATMNLPPVINAPTNTNIAIGPLTDNATLKFGIIVGAPGTAGTGFPGFGGPPAGNGTAVDIGDSAVITYAGDIGAPHPGTFKTIVGTAAKGGAGGSGYQDPGELKGTTFNIHSGQGGSGGSVTVFATDSVTIGTCLGGDAGQGGAMIGVATGPGVSIAGQSGGGGANPGFAHSTPANTGTTFDGHAGNPGDIDVTASKGAAPGSLDGGSVDAQCGIVGAPSDYQPPAIIPHLVSISVGAGSGASATSSVAGGAGGSVKVRKTDGTAVNYRSYAINVTAASGGAGYSPGCGTAKAAATNGGAGGNVDFSSSKYTLTGEADGGDGGTGSPRGIGGVAGTDAFTGRPIGTTGLAGKDCGSVTGLTLVKTIQPGGNVNCTGLDAELQKLFAIGNAAPQTSFEETSLSGSSSSKEVSAGADLAKSQSALATTNGGPGQRTSGGPNLVYMALKGAGQIGVYNAGSDKFLAPINIPGVATGSPNAVAFDTSNGRLYADTGTGIAVFDTTKGNQYVTTISTGVPVNLLRVNPTTHAIFADQVNFSVSPFLINLLVIDGTSDKIAQTAPLSNAAGDIAINPTTNRAYVLLKGFGVGVFDPVSGTFLTQISIANPGGVAVDPIRNRFFVDSTTISGNKFPSSLSEYNGATNQLVGSIAVGQFATGITVDPVQDLIYVANQQDSTITVLNGN